MRDELREDDVGLSGDGGSGVPRRHSGGEFGCTCCEARKLTRVSPACIGRRSDRREGSRFEIEFRSHSRVESG